MKRLKKRSHYSHRTLSDGRTIIHGLNKACLQVMKERNTLDFGIFMMFPTRDSIFKKIIQGLLVYGLIKNKEKANSLPLAKTK